MTNLRNHHHSRWHFTFSEVRAYRVNWKDKHSFDPILDNSGKLNPTRIPLNGVKLTEDQALILQKVVYGNHPAHPLAACLYPHHAFLFFDADGSIVGQINICFICYSYHGLPQGFASQWDLAALSELFRQLNMPIKNPRWG